jgi:serine/threonine-protein kinase RsbW
VPHRFGCHILRSLTGLTHLGPWIDRVAARLGLPPSSEYALRLCLEEAVGNIVLHGDQRDRAGATDVTVVIDADETSLRITIEDLCAPFDVATHEIAPIDTQPGGHGIRLMRRFARTIGYSRLAHAKRLTLTIAR